MRGKINVGLAQLDVRLGEVERNLERHLEWVERAREREVDLLLFPELSLTGYRLLHLTSRVALHPGSSPVIRRLAEAANGIRLVVGVVEEDDHGVLYNSALLLSEGRVAHVHRKLYLPTYGIFQEDRFFGAGSRLAPAAADGGVLGVLICEDLWHPHLARGLATAGAKVIAVASAGPGRIGSGPVAESQEAWEALTRSTAIVNTSWVLYCNRVGWEEGSFYGGGSHIVRPSGEILVRAPFLEEDLLVARLDLREVDRMRWRTPLLQDQRFDIEGAP